MSKNSIVIYKSKTGFTQKYAQWIAETLGCPAVPYEKRDTVSLANVEAVIYGGWVSAGKISGLDWLQKQLPELQGKRVAVFAVGACPTHFPGAESVLRDNFTDPSWAAAGKFYVQGGMNYSRLGPLEKLAMKAMCALIRKKEGENSEAYRNISHSYDASSREALQPLLQFVSGK